MQFVQLETSLQQSKGCFDLSASASCQSSYSHNALIMCSQPVSPSFQLCNLRHGLDPHPVIGLTLGTKHNVRETSVGVPPSACYSAAELSQCCAHKRSIFALGIYCVIIMYRHLTLRVLFQSCILADYKYRARNRCRYVVIAKYEKALMTPSQCSACHVEEQLHWSLPIWLPYMIW